MVISTEARHAVCLFTYRFVTALKNSIKHVVALTETLHSVELKSDSVNTLQRESQQTLSIQLFENFTSSLPG